MSPDPKRPRSLGGHGRARSAPARARCSGPSGSPRTTSASRRSASRRSWNEVTPCNYHLDKLAALAKEGVRQGGAVPIEFTTIAVSDGIAMGHEGMKASLISRDVIADSVELVMHAERMDALVGIAGCDKSEPGMLMAMARLNLPAVYLYGGTILPGTYRGRDITIQDVFEAVGSHAKGAIDDDELLAIERAACPDDGLVRRHVHGEHDGRRGRGARDVAARAPRRRPPSTTAARCSRASPASRSRSCSSSSIRPRDIMTKEAFENAIAVMMALAGSTNAVLHLLAIAHEAQVELELDDFDRISRTVPAPRRRATGRAVRDERPRPRRRRAGRDAGAARRRAAARRLPDRHREDDRGEPRRDARSAAPDGDGRAPARRPDPRRGRHGDPVRLARARGLGHEDRRRRVARLPRAAPGCSTPSRRRSTRSRGATSCPAT